MDLKLYHLHGYNIGDTFYSKLFRVFHLLNDLIYFDRRDSFRSARSYSTLFPVPPLNSRTKLELVRSNVLIDFSATDSRYSIRTRQDFFLSVETGTAVDEQAAFENKIGRLNRRTEFEVECIYRITVVIDGTIRAISGFLEYNLIPDDWHLRLISFRGVPVFQNFQTVLG